MFRFRTSIAVALSILLLVSISLAQQTPTTSVPNLIRYGGTLKDASAAPIASTMGVTFAIYKQQDGGAALWMETQNITPDANGQYSVLLGSTSATGLPGDLFSQEEQRWLGVQVQGQVEQPRVLLVSVPYAFKAHEAETLAGKSISDFVLAKDLNSTNSSGVVVSGAGPGHSQATAGQSNNSLLSKLATLQGPTNFSGSTTDQIVKVTQTGSGLGILAATTSTTTSDAVVGTIAGPGVAIFGQAYSTSAMAYGVEGMSASTIGVGLLGFATATTGSTYGLKGYSSSTGGTGVRGLSTATTGSTVGISASVSSPAGTAGVFNNTAGGKVISGQNNGVEKFSVDGNGNVNSTLGSYQIGGHNVLNVGSLGDANLFLGVGAGASNVAGSGRYNLFAGYQAGYSNTTGETNTFFGYYAGSRNTTGDSNTFYGALAGHNNLTGNNNIYIGNAGLTSESSTIRIGGDIGIGFGPQTAAYISGIYRSTVGGSGVAVYVDSNGQLGTVVSSRRFKEQIADMGDSSNGLLKLRPVTFLYRPEYDKGPRTLQYGLIAEEVAEVYPELVAYDQDGAPYTLKYQYLAPMLLNELQKQHAVVAAQQDVIKTQQEEIKEMQQRLSRLESLIPQTVAQK